MTLPQAELDELALRARVALGWSVAPAVLQAWLAEVAPKQAATLDVGLVLACGLFHHEPEALRSFESRVIPRVRAALQKLGAGEAELDEHLQATRARLLVENGGARLKLYRGQGSFESFAITTAVRSYTDAHRGPQQKARGDDDALAALPATMDLERQLARSGQSAFFAQAFREALEQLSPRDRALLKLNLVDGASIDELAPLYQVSRATVARWLAASRQLLRAGTLERLAARTRLQGEELDGLLASLESGFDVSLRRFVTEAAELER